METITLKINESVFDKFQWLISHFSKNEIDIVNEIDVAKLSMKDFDYLSNETLSALKIASNDFKNGQREDFVEYPL